MMQKFPIKMTASVVMLCVAWLWYSSNSDSTSGAVAASQEPESVPVSENVSGLLFRNSDLNDDLAAKFNSAIDLIENNQDQDAIAQLKEIIKLQPQAIEPYINLASLYAKSNDIEQANDTLKKAIRANDNTSVLFESLQSLYAAQAALAYQRALEIKTIDDKALAVNLPTISTLMVDRPNEADQVLNEKNQQLASKLTDGEQKLAALQLKFKEVDQQRALLLTSNAQLQETREQQAAQVGSQSDAQTEQVSRLKLELDKSEQENADLVQKHKELIAQLESQANTKIAALERQLEQTLSASAVTVQAVVKAEDSKVDESIKQRGIAIKRVKAWASSWAAQDVAAYISFYKPDFRPSSGASNKNWRAQRQVRLTNKSFIEIQVADFKVEDRGEQFVVVFSQHYKANNVNDKIFKRLVFEKGNGDWAQAKISSEQVVSN